jgi:predicted DNA-binding protein
MERMRLTSLVFRIPKQRLERLKELSKKTRVRQSEYLREAIADLLNKYEQHA